MTLLTLLQGTFSKTASTRRYSQVAHLIRDYYREDRDELRRLHSLSYCRLVRRWGVLHIKCPDRAIANEIVESRALLCEPLAQLRLANKIKITVEDYLIGVFAVPAQRSQKA